MAYSGEYMAELALTLTPDRNRPPSEGFIETTSVAALAMRSALAQFVSSLPGNIQRPRDLQRVLGLDYNVCWRVFNVLRSADGMAAASHMPKRPSIQRLIEVSEQIGAPAAVVESLKTAANDFNDAIRIHAGNRAAFDAMVSGMGSSGGKPEVDVLERRTAFRANTHIWGSQVDTFVMSVFVHKNPTQPANTDECMLTERLGLQRLRAGASAIAYHYLTPIEGSSCVSSERQPLDPDAQQFYGASLLPEFCTQPLPTFKKISGNSPYIVHELMDDAIGRCGAVDMAFGAFKRNTVLDLDVEGRPMYHANVNFLTPAARLVFDLLVHRPSFGKITPELKVFDSIPGFESPRAARPAQQLPIAAEIVHMAGGIHGAHTQAAPRHVDMLNYACEKLGWEPAEFDIYRVVIDYPVLHSTVRILFYP